MKPFRATYKQLDYDCTSEKEPEPVLVIEILPTQTDILEAEVVFVRANGSLYSDVLSRFTNCIVPWPSC